MAATSYGVGRIDAGEGDAWIMGRLRPAVAKPLVIWCHYSAGSALTTIEGGPGTLLRRLADHGFVIVGTDMGAAPRKNWGNAEAQARIASARTWGQANLPVASGKVHLVCSSMGTVAALRYAALNSANVGGVVAILPVPNMQAARVYDGGLRADIDAAWGVTYPASLPANSDPATMTVALNGLNYQSWVASDDPLATAALNDDFASDIGADPSYDLGPVGHTDSGIAAVDASMVAFFLSQAT